MEVSSAGSTAFCLKVLDGPGGYSLHIDGNGKITAGNGTLDKPSPNAFSLVQIADCPGSTNACREACYVHGLQKHAPDVHRMYVRNSDAIRRILAECAEDWASHMAEYITFNCQGGFRWHVSGDVFSAQYARFITKVVERSPRVRHWIYTRSLDFVPILASVSTRRGGNLSLNVSADIDNARNAMVVADAYGARVCYMSRDGEVPPGLPEDSVIFPDYMLRGTLPAGQQWFEGLAPREKAMVCPVDMWGKTEVRRCGRCPRCML